MNPSKADLNNLDKLCRNALRERRVEAFDNVDIEMFLAKVEIPATDAEWIGRHMMLNSYSVEVYREGQALVRQARAILQGSAA